MNVKNGKEDFDSVMTNPVSLEFYNEKKLSARGVLYKAPLAYILLFRVTRLCDCQDKRWLNKF